MIMVFAGTKDARALIFELEQKGYQVLAATATDYGKSLINHMSTAKVIGRPMSYEDMINTIQEKQITKVIDATHPYAQQASENIIKACKYTKAFYIRYERPEVVTKGVEYYDTYEEIVNLLKEKEGNILLTIGSNNLKIFTEKIPLYRIYARVLPTIKVIEKSILLGLKPKNIIGLQGPFSKEMNEIMIKDYKIKYLVTKDSGEVGGTIEKIEAAKNQNIGIYVKKRPRIQYPLQCGDIKEIIGLLRLNDKKHVVQP